MASTQADNMKIPSLSSLGATLSSFASSSSNFRIVSSTSLPTTSSPSTLYVLDSSFNPPTRAHHYIATSALKCDPGEQPKRLLLLLSTQNADKAPKPASFEHRLAMMSIFAFELSSTSSSAIDIGVTKFPYFSDKAESIQQSKAYPQDTTQVHLTGFDTLIRILDSKYYDDKTLKSLDPFLSRHRLRVTYRATDKWGGKEEQDAYLQKLEEGGRESEGGKREWATRIEMVDGVAAGGISSTKVREAVGKVDEGELKRLCTEEVAGYVLQEKLYLAE